MVFICPSSFACMIITWYLKVTYPVVHNKSLLPVFSLMIISLCTRRLKGLNTIESSKVLFHICKLIYFHHFRLLKEVTSPKKVLLLHMRKVTTQVPRSFSIRTCLQSTSLLAVQRLVFKTTLCKITIYQFDNFLLFAISRKLLQMKSW